MNSWHGSISATGISPPKNPEPIPAQKKDRFFTGPAEDYLFLLFLDHGHQLLLLIKMHGIAQVLRHRS